MNTEIFNELGIAKNEGHIYMTLIKYGGMGVSAIAIKSSVHRRNVYDSMQRLIERGLVYEEIGDKENKYFAVDPSKLLEILDERRSKVETALPDLLKQFVSSAVSQSVTIYRGLEGVKNYIRLIEREKQEIFLYGALGASLSPKVLHAFQSLVATLSRKNIVANVLYKQSIINKSPDVIGHMGPTSKNKILSKDFDDLSTYTVFGDYTCFQSNEYSFENFENKGETTLFIIKSKGIADMMRNQFMAVWKVSKDIKKIKS